MQTPIEFAGRVFSLDDQFGCDLVAKQMGEGWYEAPLPMLIMAALCRTGGLFCDVGANNGLYSVLACAARPDIKVVAFEPYTPVISVLRKNIEANDIGKRVRICEIALSDRDGNASLYVPDASHGLLETSCSLERDFKSATEDQSVVIRRQRLDSIANNLGIISVIKVDIEGHELSFLRGAEHTLRAQRPIIFAEMLPASYAAFGATTKLIDSMDFIKFRLRPSVAIYSPHIIVDHAAWNYAFIPREKMNIFEDCCLSHNVGIFSDFNLCAVPDV